VKRGIEENIIITPELIRNEINELYKRLDLLEKKLIKHK